MGKFVCMYFLEKLLNFSKAATGDVLEKHLCRFKKETPTQVFSCEYCEILRTAFLIEHLGWLRPNFAKWLVFRKVVSGFL